MPTRSGSQYLLTGPMTDPHSTDSRIELTRNDDVQRIMEGIGLLGQRMQQFEESSKIMNDRLLNIEDRLPLPVVAPPQQCKARGCSEV